MRLLCALLRREWSCKAILAVGNLCDDTVDVRHRERLSRRMVNEVGLLDFLEPHLASSSDNLQFKNRALNPLEAIVKLPEFQSRVVDIIRRTGLVDQSAALEKPEIRKLLWQILKTLEAAVRSQGSGEEEYLSASDVDFIHRSLETVPHDRRLEMASQVLRASARFKTRRRQSSPGPPTLAHGTSSETLDASAAPVPLAAAADSTGARVSERSQGDIGPSSPGSGTADQTQRRSKRSRPHAREASASSHEPQLRRRRRTEM